MEVRAFVQARMSSTRFPGKVLAPLAGKPVIDHVVDRVAEVLPREAIVVATSTERSDDPLVHHLERRGVPVFRGPLDDVVSRFQGCLAAHPCAWFVRVCADSPLLDPGLLQAMLPLARGELDLVTNTFPRSFPKGLSLEVVRASTFARLDPAMLTPEQREHATRAYYDRPAAFSVLNVSAGRAGLAEQSVALDTLDDLRRLEGIVAAGGPAPLQAVIPGRLA